MLLGLIACRASVVACSSGGDRKQPEIPDQPADPLVKAINEVSLFAVSEACGSTLLGGPYGLAQTPCVGSADSVITNNTLTLLSVSTRMPRYGSAHLVDTGTGYTKWFQQ